MIGVDNGYQNVKTANFLFENGIREMSVEPSIKEHTLFINGKYYKVGEGRARLSKDYYKKTLTEMKKMVKEEMQNHDMRVLAVLASNGNYSSINLADVQKNGKGMELPKESKELPEGMESVLKMFQ